MSHVLITYAVTEVLVATFAALGLGLAFGVPLRALRRRGHRALRYLAWPFFVLFVLLLGAALREIVHTSFSFRGEFTWTACVCAWLVQRGTIGITFRKIWKAEPVGPENAT